MQIESKIVDYKKLEGLDPDKSLAQQAFTRLLRQDGQVTGDLLDIGAGPGPNPFLANVFGEDAVIDGVDIDPCVLENKQLRRCWHSPFETSDIPSNHYGLATAYNVVEHIDAARPFFEKLADVLKPGGVFWAYTPNARHPFAILSRSIELIGLKGHFAAVDESVNDYPAYYRLNSLPTVTKTIRDLPFVSAKFYYLYVPGWVNYFPKAIQFAPKMYDAVTAGRSTGVIVYRLEKSS